MRQAINDNKTVQIALVGVLLVAAVLMLMTRMKSSSGGETAPPPDGGAVPGAVSGDSGASDSGASGAGVAPSTASTAPTTGVTASTSSALPTASSTSTSTGSGGTVPPEALVPGPGLPAPVIRAFAKGDAVVLLIVGRGTDDKLVRESVDALSKPGIAVFVTPAKNVARYSRITQGVGVSQVPALVVVRPRSVSGSTPQAEVSYGFRNSQSVVQAVNDALYKGRDDLPYSPR